MQQLQQAVIAGSIGMIVTLLLGLVVKKFLDKVVPLEPSPPDNLNPAYLASWETLAAALPIDGQRYSTWVGVFEQLLFFFVFWTGAYLLTVGWLAFKVASKWQTWQHIIKLPRKLGNLGAMEDFRLRNEFGTRLGSRFLIGTLYNMFCGAIGALAGNVLLELWRATTTVCT